MNAKVPIVFVSLDDKCISSTCENNAICVIDKENGSAKCQCLPGYYGRQCQNCKKFLSYCRIDVSLPNILCFMMYISN